MFPDFRKSVPFLKVPRLRLSVLLVRVVHRRRRVCSPSHRPLPTKHTANLREEHTCPQRHSNPQYRQSSGCSPSPYAAWPPRSVGHKILHKKFCNMLRLFTEIFSVNNRNFFREKNKRLHFLITNISIRQLIYGKTWHL